MMNVSYVYMSGEPIAACLSCLIVHLFLLEPMSVTEETISSERGSIVLYFVFFFIEIFENAFGIFKQPNSPSEWIGDTSTAYSVVIVAVTMVIYTYYNNRRLFFVEDWRFRKLCPRGSTCRPFGCSLSQTVF